MPKVLIDDDGIRPEGKPDECFYCNQKVGSPHKMECVTLTKKVKLQVTIEIEKEEPYSWSAELIEFARNDSSWCANNIMENLIELDKKLNEENNCLCSIATFKVIQMSNDPPIQRNKTGKVINSTQEGGK